MLTGGGRVSATTATSDAQGLVQPTWTLGPVPGGNSLQASADGPPAIAYASGSLRWGQLSTGPSISCGITTGGTGYCWGYNASGATGSGVATATPISVPTRIAGSLSFTKIAVGTRENACALTADGSAYCWGFNRYGTLGDGTTTDSPAPVAVAGGLKFRDISVGATDACAVTLDNVAYCWGGYVPQSNSGNPLGHPTSQSCPFLAGPGGMACSLVPEAVSGGIAFRTISAGNSTTCGLDLGGAAYCWGSGSTGRFATARIRRAMCLWRWRGASPSPRWTLDILAAAQSKRTVLRAAGAIHSP